MQRHFLQAFSHLRETSPALFYAIPFALGTFFALESGWAPLLFLFFLFMGNLSKSLTLTLLFLAPLPLIQTAKEGAQGEGTFVVEAITKSPHPFGSPWCYRGKWSFEEREKGRRLPVLFFPKKKLATDAFYAVGRVEKRGAFYRLKCETLTPFPKWSIAPYRLKAKMGVKRYIRAHTPHKQAADFLCGIVTGEIENRLLSSDFSKLGLSHLLAISGLHFGLIALFLRRLVFFLPRKGGTVVIALLLTLYALFIGYTPSIQRAWTFALLLYIGELFNRRCQTLNTLGVALFLAALFSPFSLKTLSFQLSFLATAGILLFYPTLRTPLASSEKGKRYLLHQITSYLKESCKLTIAVHIAILPLLIERFHSFQVHTLFYNLFFPTAAALSLILFLTSIFLPPLHVVNSHYTQLLLQIVDDPPFLLPPLYFESVSPWLTGSALVALFLYALSRREQNALTSGKKSIPYF